jgi:hypothetical protein
MLTLTWTCPTCGKEHHQDIAPENYGKFTAFSCSHMVNSAGMGSNGGRYIQTEYFYFQLPKIMTAAELEGNPSESDSAKLQQAWEEFFMAFAESIGIPKFLRWLNDKLIGSGVK